MTTSAMEALRVESGRARDLFASLSNDEWQAPSACAGWRVQDVAQHMASVFHSIADPSTIEGGTSTDVEQNAEVPVQARRAWTSQQVMDEYDEWSAKGIAALGMMQEPGMAEMVIPLANLGSHPMHLLGNAIVFDHYCHLRHDIGVAVPRAADLPRDAEPLRATLEWMLAGLPQMCAQGLGTCTQGINLQFVGAGGGSFVLAPGGDGWTVSEGSETLLPTAASTVHDFISWGTKRADWRNHVVLSGGSGDSRVLAQDTLEAINVI